MPPGPGKYDEIATMVRKLTEAESVIVMVVKGNQGDGFSVQSASLNFVVGLPTVLRQMADSIEQSLKGESENGHAEEGEEDRKNSSD